MRTIGQQLAMAGTISGQLDLTGDARHRHIPGSPLDWRHEWIPITPQAAKSHFRGHIPAGWHPPGGSGESSKASGPPSMRALAAKHGLRVLNGNQGETLLLPKGGGIVSPVLRSRDGHLTATNGEEVHPHEADAYLAAYRQHPKALSAALLDIARGNIKPSAPPKNARLDTSGGSSTRGDGKVTAPAKTSHDVDNFVADIESGRIGVRYRASAAIGHVIPPTSEGSRYGAMSALYSDLEHGRLDPADAARFHAENFSPRTVGRQADDAEAIAQILDRTTHTDEDVQQWLPEHPAEVKRAAAGLHAYAAAVRERLASSHPQVRERAREQAQDDQAETFSSLDAEKAYRDAYVSIGRGGSYASALHTLARADALEAERGVPEGTGSRAKIARAAEQFKGAQSNERKAGGREALQDKIQQGVQARKQREAEEAAQRDAAGRAESARVDADAAQRFQLAIGQRAQAAAQLAADLNAEGGFAGNAGRFTQTAAEHLAAGRLQDALSEMRRATKDLGVHNRRMNTASGRALGRRLDALRDDVSAEIARQEEPGRKARARETQIAQARRMHDNDKSGLPGLVRVSGDARGMTAIDHEGNEHQISLKSGTVSVTRDGRTLTAPAGDDPTITARQLAGQLRDGPAPGEPGSGYSVQAGNGTTTVTSKAGHMLDDGRIEANMPSQRGKTTRALAGRIERALASAPGRSPENAKALAEAKAARQTGRMTQRQIDALDQENDRVSMDLNTMQHGTGAPFVSSQFQDRNPQPSTIGGQLAAKPAAAPALSPERAQAAAHHADWMRIGNFEDGHELGTGYKTSGIVRPADFNVSVKERSAGSFAHPVKAFDWQIDRQRTEREGPDERGSHWEGPLHTGSEPTMAKAKSAALKAMKAARAQHLAAGGDVGYGDAATGDEIRAYARSRGRQSAA